MEDYLNKLAYNGELYHYTDFNGYKKILHPYNEFSDSEYEFPKDCIALQFKRIDLMTKNDNK